VKTDSLKSLKQRDKIPNNGEGTTPVKSIFRATRILQCLDNDIHSIKEIAARCELSMTTVHRILQTLEESELVFQDPIEHRYYLGQFFTKLSLNQSRNHKYLAAQAYEEANRIAELFGEFVAFDVEVGMQVVTLIQIQSRFNYSISKLVKPMFYGSVSKAMIAQKSDAEIEMMLKSITPKPPSEYCVTDKGKIKEQIKEVKRQGYCVSRREIDEGIMGISVPVKNYICAVALSVVGPEIRLDPITDEVNKEMMISASRISAKLSRKR